MQLDAFQTRQLPSCRQFKLKLLSLLFFSMLIFTQAIQADSHVFYSLARAGSFVIKSNDIEDIQVVGFVVGLRIDNALYLESEINTTISGGEYFSAGEKGQLNITNFSLYGVYRYVFNIKFYGKLKAGIAYNYLDYDKSFNKETKNNSGEFSGGVGFGLGVVFSAFSNPFMVELEYTSIDKDINLITIGLTSPF
ncbi:MAG: outer membrane beta-barrel protein [Thiohalomonadales bacterium]